jgi:hypothetical protein
MTVYAAGLVIVIHISSACLLDIWGGFYPLRGGGAVTVRFHKSLSGCTGILDGQPFFSRRK